MRYLLDTHALIWWWLGDPLLSPVARGIMADGTADILVSAATACEIAIKVRIGKLPTMSEPLALFDESVLADGFAHLPVRYDHARRAGMMPGKHRDPFDRLLAAQAQIERLTVITRDPAIAGLSCAVIW